MYQIFALLEEYNNINIELKMEGNNMSGNIAFLRDTFLDAENKYLEELMKQPKYKAFIEKLNHYGSVELSLEAIRRISDIETGKVM